MCGFLKHEHKLRAASAFYWITCCYLIWVFSVSSSFGQIRLSLETYYRYHSSLSLFLSPRSVFHLKYEYVRKRWAFLSEWLSWLLIILLWLHVCLCVFWWEWFLPCFCRRLCHEDAKYFIVCVCVCRSRSVRPGVKLKLCRTRRPALPLLPTKRRWRDLGVAAMRRKLRRMERVCIHSRAQARTLTHTRTQHLRNVKPAKCNYPSVMDSPQIFQ